MTRHLLLLERKVNMVSLIITVKNENTNIRDWFESLKTQTRFPDEIVIVDGGSTDGTWEYLQSIASETVHVFQEKGNIAHGRNYAITHATGDIIVATDAGCTYTNNWLEAILAPLESGEVKSAATAFKPWLKAGDSLVVVMVASATIPVYREFNKKWFPSSRSCAFLKSVWSEVGGYPEWIPFCEDVIFDIKIEKKGNKTMLINDLLVAWRPRSTVSSYCRQLYNYTRSDAHGKLFYMRQSIRFIVYTALLALLTLVITYSLWFGGVIVIFGSIYMIKFWNRLFEFSKTKKISSRILGFVLLPVIILIGDCSKMFGWVVGLIERWSGKIKYQSY